MSPTGLATARFDADLPGAGAPVAGTTCAVFDGAALVALPAGELLTLVRAERDLVPGGVAIPWDEVPPRLGERIELAHRRLRVGHRSLIALTGPGVQLSLPTDLAPPVPEILVEQRVRLALPGRAREVLNHRGDDDTTTVLGRRLEALVAALVADDALEVDRLVPGLVGLGFGSTPTGDDLLTGVAGALRRLGESPGGAAGAAPCGDATSSFARALGRVPVEATTPVGRAMLAYAARGRFPEALVAFLTALGSPAAPSLDAPVARLVCLGSGSGAEMLAGVLATEAAWRRL